MHIPFNIQFFSNGPWRQSGNSMVLCSWMFPTWLWTGRHLASRSSASSVDATHQYRWLVIDLIHSLIELYFALSARLASFFFNPACILKPWSHCCMNYIHIICTWPMLKWATLADVPCVIVVCNLWPLFAYVLLYGRMAICGYRCDGDVVCV